ncbi:MarR family winged helix-turn-helix transcriptional regulator [Novosphingobium sp. PY1]|uniref:MarR family winged helix-turn-helix transcriptional regulator n=1 Tax=Novosphingobium sp. PY1 TaxID=1882221 RepID=UPI000BE78279|nr:MarR family winged helix-turn-helix transcriptional regulator [Novosphingobium sp. PY1]BBA74165.1 MarR family transcriptional regulator [Novosphingobium sp. PY1]GFM31402.1 MarR family transcriptional regulator [Novosphingobium sp. PY1]
MTQDISDRSPDDGTGSHADTLHRLLKLSNKLLAPFSTHLERQYKISINEFRLLMLIGRYPGCASHELVDMTGVSAMSVSRAVFALERNDRIRVERDPQNKRRKRLNLTEEGERLFRIMEPQTGQVADYLMSKLLPHEVAMFDHILRILIDTLEATDEEGNSLFLERTRPQNDPE